MKSDTQASVALVIIPTYNEKDNLPRILQAVLALPALVDVLVVDDGSPDGTGQIADEWAARDSRVHVLHRLAKNGLGRAYCAGFQWALERHYEYILEMDGDFSHNPKDIPAFLTAAQNADLVLGSRYWNGIRVINWPMSRLLLSVGAALYVRCITGMPFTDPTGGFKCFRRKALEAIDPGQVHSNGYSFQIEMTHKVWRKGLRVAELPIIFTERFLGCSKMSGGIVWEAIGMVWRLLFQNQLSRKPQGHPSKVEVVVRDLTP